MSKNKLQFSEEVFSRARVLFPINYELIELIRNNDPKALDIIRDMEVEPYIHVNEILQYLNPELYKASWGIANLKAKAERISDIIALEELMMDELNIMKINE